MTENELASFVGTVKPIGLTILFVLANLVRPPRIADLARIISMNAKTLSPEMDRLALLGYVQALPAGRHPRWVLTDKAKQLPLFALSELTGMLLAGQPVRSEARSGMLLAEQPSPGEEPEEDDQRKVPLSPPKVGNEQRNSPLTAAVVVVDQISDLDLDQDQDQQQQQAAVSGEILRSEHRTAILSACIELGIGYPTNRRLADNEWVTADRLYRAARQCKLEGRWENPIGQAITRLEDHLEPKTTTELDTLEARSSDQRFTTVKVAGAEEHGAEETSRGISVDMPRPPAPDPDREAQQTWQAALGELQLQMTRPTFETYIRPAILVRYAPSNSPVPLFVLAVENEFLRDWLATKLLSSITRALAGITNRSVMVHIVTWSEATGYETT